MTFTDDTVNGWLAVIADRCYLALHFDNPATAGAYASEYSGDGYVRQKVHFSNPDNRAIWNSNALSYTGLNAGTISYIGGWNAQSQGDLLFYSALARPFRLARGQGYTVNGQQIVLSLD